MSSELPILTSLAAHHWRRHRIVLAPMMTGLALFHFLITRMAPAPNELNWISQVFALLPRQLLAIAGQGMSEPTAAGFIAVGYGHPFMALLFSAWVIRVSCGATAGEIGRGTMDLLASRPVPRWQHIAAPAAVTSLGVVLLGASAWGGTTLGLAIRYTGVSPAATLQIAGGAVLLFVAWGFIAIAIGALHRTGGAAIGWTAGVIATSFVLEYVTRLWSPVAALHPYTLFAYYDAQAIVREGLAVKDTMVLLSISVAAFALAIAMFERRDL
jgi:ABC-type transport system involved in multi-copper enzyme maturation permease subunit